MSPVSYQERRIDRQRISYDAQAELGDEISNSEPGDCPWCEFQDQPAAGHGGVTLGAAYRYRQWLRCTRPQLQDLEADVSSLAVRGPAKD